MSSTSDLLSKTSSAVLEKLDEKHQQMQKMMQSLEDMFVPIPDRLQQLSKEVSDIRDLLSGPVLAQAAAEIHDTFVGVRILQEKSEGDISYKIALVYHRH